MCYINYVCAVQFDHANTEDRHYKQIIYLRQIKIYTVSNSNNRTY